MIAIVENMSNLHPALRNKTRGKAKVEEEPPKPKPQPTQRSRTKKPMNPTQVRKAAERRSKERKVKKEVVPKRNTAPQKKPVRGRSKSKSRSVSNTSEDSEASEHAVVKTVVHEPVAFEVEEHVRRKTAKELMEEKRAQMLRKPKYTPEEYAAIQEKRRKADLKRKKAEKKGEVQVVKATITERKKTVKKGNDDDVGNKYVVEFEEMSSEEADNIPAADPIQFKELDDNEFKEVINYGMNVIGKREISEKAKVAKADLDNFRLEDLGGGNQSKTPITNIVDINKVITSRIMSQNMKDIVMIGPSESTKDSIMEIIQGSRIGRKGHVFDADLEENENKKIPAGSIAVFSDETPVKPPEKPTDPKALAAWKKNPPKIRPYKLRSDYPTARFYYLTKVSDEDHLDWKKYHANVAPFIDYKEFKEICRELLRFEFLIIDILDKKVYKMEIS